MTSTVRPTTSTFTATPTTVDITTTSFTTTAQIVSLQPTVDAGGGGIFVDNGDGEAGPTVPVPTQATNPFFDNENNALDVQFGTSFYTLFTEIQLADIEVKTMISVKSRMKKEMGNVDLSNKFKATTAHMHTPRRLDATDEQEKLHSSKTALCSDWNSDLALHLLNWQSWLTISSKNQLK